MLHDLLTGAPPGPGQAALPPSSPLAALALACLAAEPDRRPEDARALAQALRGLAAVDRRPRLSLAAALAILTFSLIILGGLLAERAQARRRHDRAAERRRAERQAAEDELRTARAQLAAQLEQRRQPPAPPSPAPRGELDDAAVKRDLMDAALRERREGPQAALAQVDALIKRAPRSVRALFFRASLHARLGQHARAIADFSAVLALQPGQYSALVNRALSKVELKDFQGALADYDAAIAAGHKLDVTYNNRGICRRKMGELDAAIADYARAIKANPRFAKPYNNRGLAYALKDEHALALQDFNRALELTPGSHEFLNNRAQSLARLGRLKEARADLDRVLAAAPDDVSALTSLSGIELLEATHPAAIARAREALRLDAAALQARINLTTALCLNGDHNEAIAEAGRVLERDPGQFRALYARGRSARALGLRDRALQDLRRLRSLNPNFRAAEVAGWIRELEEKK